MTDAELAMLFLEYIRAAVEVMFGFFSLTSAFLATTYLVGTEISHQLARVVVGLFSFASIVLIAIAQRHLATVVSIRDELVSHGVTWHLATTEPQFILPSLVWAVFFCMSLVAIASLWYFVSTRMQGASDE